MKIELLCITNYECSSSVYLTPIHQQLCLFTRCLLTSNASEATPVHQEFTYLQCIRTYACSSCVSYLQCISTYAFSSCVYLPSVHQQLHLFISYLRTPNGTPSMVMFRRSLTSSSPSPYTKLS